MKEVSQTRNEGDQNVRLRGQSKYLSFNLDYLDTSLDPICRKYTQVVYILKSIRFVYICPI